MLKRIAFILAFYYHATLIYIHDVLHDLGLRSDEQADVFSKKHTMKIVKMFERIAYNNVK